MLKKQNKTKQNKKKKLPAGASNGNVFDWSEKDTEVKFCALTNGTDKVKKKKNKVTVSYDIAGRPKNIAEVEVSVP